jgi:biotin synthase
VRYESGIPEYDLMEPGEIGRHAEAARARGSQALGIVTAWRGVKKGKTLNAILERIRELAKVEGLHADASLGIIDDPEIPFLLKEAGLHTYNHNLESSRAFYPQVCNTHSFDERVQTIRLLKAAGIRICSGGIFNMGESRQDRVDLAFELKALDVDVIPLNFLNPMDGTPMGGRPLMPPMEALRTIAMFRFVHPKKEIMVAGGREVNLRDLQGLMFVAGASATMAGSYLTSTGRATADDWQMIRDLEMDYRPPGAERPPGEAETLAKRLEPGLGASPQREPIRPGVRFPILGSADL